MNLDNSVSDPCPILLDTDVGVSGRAGGSFNFKFETRWLLETSCETEVKKLWELKVHLDVPNHLMEVGEGLRNWATRLKRNKRRMKENLQDHLGGLYELPPTDDNLEEIIEIKLGLNMGMDREELYWEQRDRSNWLRYGDQNTRCFHSCAAQRRRSNQILGLVDRNRVVRTDMEDTQNIVVEYFWDIFSTVGCEGAKTVFSRIQRCVDDSMNAMLGEDFKAEEVFVAMKEMGSIKALGRDGFPVVFYQKFRAIIESEMTNYCLRVLWREQDLFEENQTHIVLLPKVVAPNAMNLFRPISLCNVLYKIVSKVIANRLKKVLDCCIDEA